MSPRDPLEPQAGNEAAQSSSPCTGGELGCSPGSSLHPAPCQGNQTFELDPKALLGCKRQRPRLPQDLPWTSSCLSFSHQAPAEQDTLQTPSEQHGALNQCLPSWHSCRTHHRCFPSRSIHPALQRSHQSRSFAREQKSSVGWEGTGKIHRDALQGKHW